MIFTLFAYTDVIVFNLVFIRHRTQFYETIYAISVFNAVNVLYIVIYKRTIYAIQNVINSHIFSPLS